MTPRPMKPIVGAKFCIACSAHRYAAVLGPCRAGGRRKEDHFGQIIRLPASLQEMSHTRVLISGATPRSQGGPLIALASDASQPANRSQRRRIIGDGRWSTA